MSNNDEATVADTETISNTSVMKDDAGCTPKKPRTECVNNGDGQRILEILAKSKNLQADHSAPRSERKKSSLMKSKFEFMGLKRKSASMASDVAIFSGDVEKYGRFTRQRNKGKKGDIAVDVVDDCLSVDKNHNERNLATPTTVVTSTETAVVEPSNNTKISKEDRRRSQRLTICNHVTELPAATNVTPPAPRTKSIRSMWRAGSRRRSSSAKTDRRLAPAMRTDAGHTPLKMRRRRHGTEFNERLIN